jgi:hypothetical protein
MALHCATALQRDYFWNTAATRPRKKKLEDTTKLEK